MQESDAVVSLAALAQPMRLRVFRELVAAGAGGLTPGVLADGLGVPAATLSFHLKELLHAGLATQERQSRNLVYRADYARMNGLIAYLMENCCQGQPCGPGATTCRPAPAPPTRPTSNRRTRHEALPRARPRP